MTILQHFVLPDPKVPTDSRLFFHLDGSADVSDDNGLFQLGSGASVRFNTYYNALSLGKWQRHTGLSSLRLRLKIKGKLELELRHTADVRGQKNDVIASTVVEASELTEVTLDAASVFSKSQLGLLWLEVRGLRDGCEFSDACFETDEGPEAWPSLLMSITTFRREAAVENTVQRMEKYLANAPCGEHIRLLVVDNGDSANVKDSVFTRRIPNANLGGAGGFTRGLIEAEAEGFTHVLFMDDDASIHMESLHRTYMLLAMSKDPNLAVAGALVTEREPWRLWENGALFDGVCQAQYHGFDLRKPSKVVRMEIETTRPVPPTFYGGWWFFAFPVAAVERYPFPFFVRGDDVNFALSNPFTMTTLNGVTSQAEDFTDKESPLNWYLDLRSHMVHHLTVPGLERGSMKLARTPINFILRNLIRFQYRTIDAVFLAWEDVMRGPEFFVENADMLQRRADIKDVGAGEVWEPVENLDLRERRWFWANGGLKWRLMRFTGNGHLLPFFRFWGNRVVVPAPERGDYGRTWGAAQITYLSADGTQGYTTRHSKRSFLQVSCRLFKMLRRWRREYPDLLKKYQSGYDEIATKSFWEKTLKRE